LEFKKFVFGESLELALEAIPEEYQLKFYRIIKDYGLHGIEPDLSGFELATWVQMKNMIDLTIPMRNNASPVGKVGAPFGNKNAQKTTINNSIQLDELNLKNNSENNQNNSEQLRQLNSDNSNIYNSANVKVNGNVNAKENGNGNGEKQPPLLLIKNKIKEQGFFFDDDNDLSRLITQIEPPWLDGCYTFIDFIAGTVKEGYGNKPKREQHMVFRKLLFDAPNLREEYPQWRQQREKDDALKIDIDNLGAAWDNHPIVCEKCGKELSYWNEQYHCRDCELFYKLNNTTLEWELCI